MTDLSLNFEHFFVFLIVTFSNKNNLFCNISGGSNEPVECEGQRDVSNRLEVIGIM